MRDGIDDYIKRHVETEAAFTGEVLDQLERRLRALEAQIFQAERKRLGPYLRRKFGKLWAAVAKRLRGRFPHERAFFRKVKRDLPPGGSPGRAKGRLFVDVTQTVRVKFMAGIPRVVLESVKVALARGGAPVFLHGGEIWTFELTSLKLQRVRPRRGDVLLLLDQSWTRQADLHRVLADFRSAGGTSVAMIHDLLPAQYPECFPPSFKTQFTDWLALIAGNVDTAIAISRDVAQAFAQWATVEGRDINPALNLAWNHLGADFDARGLKPGRGTRKFVGASAAPYFLSVSTVEPRKGYGVALEAMELLWRDGVDARYVIVGRYGWGAQALAHRLRIHPENGKRLAWFEGLGDGDLDHLMKHARALVFPTVGEGFGLPIVEAARYGLPVIGSDIPVFREIAGDGIAYFAPGDAYGLARRMRDALAKPTPAKIDALTWRQSADAFIDIVEKDSYPVRGLAELQAFAGRPVATAPWAEPATGRPPAVSIVTVTRDSLFYTRLQVEKVRESAAGRDYEIIVVDRGSRDGTLEWLAAQPDVRVIDYAQTRTAGHGHGEAAEIGVRAAHYARIALLDSDAFPVDPRWLESTVDRLDETHRLAGAAFVADRVWHDHGWYVHPHFMAFFKADLGGLIMLRKLRGDDEDTGEESTIRVLAAGKQIVRHPIEFYAPLGVGRQDIPTISAGVVHAWYSSRLALQEPEVKRESAGAISVASYGAPLQDKIRAQFGLSY